MKKVATYMRVSNHSASDESLRKQASEVNEYCANKGYNVEDTVSVVGDRELGYKMLMKMLAGAKEKGIDTVVMKSTNRVIGKVDEIKMFKNALDDSGVKIETMDNSHLALDMTNLVESFLANADAEAQEELQSFGEINM